MNSNLKTRTIHTGLYGVQAKAVIDGVHGQLSDGKWENTPGYDKYWTNFAVETADDGEVVFDAQCLARISGHFGRAIYNRSTELKHLCLFKSFEDQLVANAVGAAVGDGHAYFVVVHGCLVLYVSLEYFNV